MSEHSIGSNPTIEEDMVALKMHMHHYRSALNDRGIWLFLATLGCWSVENAHMQILAFLITFYLFFTQLTESQKDKRTAPLLVAAVKDRIAKADLDDKSRNKYLFDLKALEREIFSLNLTTFRNALPFFLPWLFFGISFVLFFAKRLALLAS